MSQQVLTQNNEMNGGSFLYQNSIIRRKGRLGGGVGEENRLSAQVLNEQGRLTLHLLSSSLLPSVLNQC